MPTSSLSAGARITAPPAGAAPLALTTVPDTRTVRTGSSAKLTVISCPSPSVTRCASLTLPVPGK